MARWSFSSVLIYSLFHVCPCRQDDYSHKRLSRWQKGLSFFSLPEASGGDCSGSVSRRRTTWAKPVALPNMQQANHHCSAFFRFSLNATEKHCVGTPRRELRRRSSSRSTGPTGRRSRSASLRVRKDRFCEGHFASMIDNGHIATILQRLAVICREMS